jgi:tetratricopeptide (TPR) repeat protein
MNAERRTQDEELRNGFFILRSAFCVLRSLLFCSPLLSLILVTTTCNKRPARPAVIIISIDTLRADRLPVYGYRGITTPALDAFARDAVVYERAWSHSPLTLPSHATILSGLLPAEHGVRDNTGFHLDEKTKLLPSILKANGYATGAAVSAYVLRSATGIANGFDAFDEVRERAGSRQSLGAVQRPGEESADVARAFIAAHAQQPFFYFLHLYEPHAPYEPTYDGEIVTSDAILGRFFDFLKEQQLYDDALIVVLSDHGEGLGDHGEDEHGIFLYREAIHVPLLVKLPKNERGGTRVAGDVGLVDVTPTILDVLGVKDTGRMDGRPFLPTLTPRPQYSETWYPRFHFGWSDLHSLVVGNEHFIDAPRPELYDLAADPAERQNVLEQRRRRYAAMRAQLAPFKREAAAPSAIDPEEAEKLAALGYIGSAAPASGPLPDPKDKTGAFRDLRRAFELYRAGKDEEALAAFDLILRDNPDMVDLWDMRSKVLFRLGRASEAIEAGQEALRRSPASGHLAVDLANQFLLTGHLDDAAAHASLALKSEPLKAHELLARIALVRGDVTAAETHANQAGDSPAALYTRARVAHRKGDYTKVVTLTATIALPGVHALRGDALARLGRDREAEAAFREEIRLAPTDAEAYRGLIVLLVAQGRTDEATQTVLALAKAAPNKQTYQAIAETLRVVGDEPGARYWAQK